MDSEGLSLGQTSTPDTPTPPPEIGEAGICYTRERKESSSGQTVSAIRVDQIYFNIYCLILRACW